MPTEKAGSGIPQGAACAFASRMCAGSRSRLDVGEARKKEGVVVGSDQVVKAPQAIEEEFTPAVRVGAQRLISVEVHPLLRESERRQLGIQKGRVGE